jgi:hypothetical protein
MLIPMLLLAVSPASGTAAPAVDQDPPIHVWLNDDGRYAFGDRAKVYVRAAEAGYVVVLRSDVRGGIRVLSPVDPDGDQAVRAGKKYEAKGRGGREAFVVEDSSGRGVVLAAWSSAPFDLSRFRRDGHWDFQALTAAASQGSAASEDAEARLLRVVDGIKPAGGHYQYDVVSYQADSPRIARARWNDGYPYPYGRAGGWWGYDPFWSRPYLGSRFLFGRPFGFRHYW